MSEVFRKLLDEHIERQAELQRLCAKAVESAEPVWMGVWGPTGHDLYLTAKLKEPPSTGNPNLGENDGK